MAQTPDRFSLDERATALSMRAEGATNDDIGAALNRSERSVRQFFNTFDWRRKQREEAAMDKAVLSRPLGSNEGTADMIRPLYVTQGLGIHAILAKANAWRQQRGLSALDLDALYRIINEHGMKRPRVIPGLRRA